MALRYFVLKKGGPYGRNDAYVVVDDEIKTSWWSDIEESDPALYGLILKEPHRWQEIQMCDLDKLITLKRLGHYD